MKLAVVLLFALTACVAAQNCGTAWAGKSGKVYDLSGLTKYVFFECCESSGVVRAKSW